MAKSQTVLVLCQNDYPLYVCPEATTREDAEAYARIVQIEMRAEHKRIHNDGLDACLYVHVQTAEMLDWATIKEKLT